jgi:hypothetical protein
MQKDINDQIILEWSSRPGPRMRRAWLIFVKNVKIYHFTGESIPGIVAILSATPIKMGKWSHYKYNLLISPGVRFLSGHAGWNTGTFREGLDDTLKGYYPTTRWHEIANALNVPVDEVRAFLTKFRPSEVQELDKIETDIADLGNAANDFEEVEVYIGGATRRLRAEGYWSWPIVVEVAGEVVGRMDISGENITGNIRVIDRTAGLGHGGGWVNFKLLAPAGARALHVNPEILENYLRFSREEAARYA